MWLAIIFGVYIDREVLSPQILFKFTSNSVCTPSGRLNSQTNAILVFQCSKGKIKHLDPRFHVHKAIHLFETQFCNDIGWYEFYKFASDTMIAFIGSRSWPNDCGSVTHEFHIWWSFLELKINPALLIIPQNLLRNHPMSLILQYTIVLSWTC